MTALETASSAPRTLPGAVRPPVSRTVLVLVLLVVALSAAVRLVDLGRFPGTVFDEYYYVHDARAVLHGGLAGTPEEPWRPSGVRSDAHPDLAKLAIAASIAAVGDGPWGWRLPAALAGIAVIALVFPLARRLGLSDEWSLAALVLAAADPMLMLESRLAVLDMFVALCTVLSVYLGLRFVQSGFRLWWLVACAAALGAAVACKWSGLLAVLAVLVVVLPPWSGTVVAPYGRPPCSRCSSSFRRPSICSAPCRTSPPATAWATGSICRSTWRRSAGACGRPRVRFAAGQLAVRRRADLVQVV